MDIVNGKGMNILEKMIRRLLLALQKVGIFKRMGLYIMPIHYYCPIPDLDKINKDPDWDLRPKQIPGIDLNENFQLWLLKNEFPKYVYEYDFPLKRSDIKKPGEFYFDNHMFANTDAEVYYCMIRYFKPRIVVEVGGGRSTQICYEASQKSLKLHNTKTNIFVIEPFPNREILIPMSKDSIHLMKNKVENIDTDFFSQLNENDILFIDSTHVIKSGGDVNYLFLDILPRLKPGVVVHIHDIRLPYEVKKTDIIDCGLFFTEEYMLRAFLIGNREFEVLWGTYFMAQKYSEKIASTFRTSNHGKYAGGSFWIRRKKEKMF